MRCWLRPAILARVARSAAVVLALLAVLTGGTAALAADDPLRDQQWHLERIGAAEAWTVGRGEGIVVAVVDTGVSLTHPDLTDRLVPGRDLVDPGTPPDDENGHGTLVAGIIAATAANGRGGAGVAPGAAIMPVRVLDAEGTGTSRNVAEGIRWAVANGADIVNLSLTDSPGTGGGELITTEVELAIRESDEAGVLVIGAAGNSSRRSTPYRAGVPVVVVAASDLQDMPWERSNSDPDTLFAPGVGIISTYLENGYARADGTSFATPVVAGAAAVLRSTGLDAVQARERLEATARDIGAGRGLLDLAAAAGGATAAAGASPQPVKAGEDEGEDEGRAEGQVAPGVGQRLPGREPAAPPSELPARRSATEQAVPAATPQPGATTVPPAARTPAASAAPEPSAPAPAGPATPTPTPALAVPTAAPSPPSALTEVAAATQTRADGAATGWPVALAAVLLSATTAAHLAMRASRRRIDWRHAP
jgi:thermitase